MKQYRMIALALLSILPWSPDLRAAPFEKQFKIVEVSGPCTVQFPNQSETAAAKGMSCPYGTAIATGRRATIVVELSNGNQVRILASTKMVMTEDEKEAKSKSIRLIEGRIRVQLETESHKHNRFTVVTPVAVCGIVGCDIEFGVEPGGTLSVIVNEGLVNLAGQTQGATWQATLDPGDKAVLKASGQNALTVQAIEGGFSVSYTDANGQPTTVPIPAGASILVTSTTVTLPNGTTAVSMTVTIQKAGGGTSTITLPPIAPRYSGQ